MTVGSTETQMMSLIKVKMKFCDQMSYGKIIVKDSMIKFLNIEFKNMKCHIALKRNEDGLYIFYIQKT